LVNKGRKDHNIRCSVESTGGSIYNVNTIRAGELDFGIVQSDWQYHGYNGTSKFAEQGPYKKLRAMFSLHTEPFNIIARADSGIENVQDLAGKRVNIGNPGSGDRATMGVVMDAMGWTNDSFKLASELKGSERSQALCDNKIDAFIYMVGHPNGSIKEATTSCDAKLVPVSDEVAYNVAKAVFENFDTFKRLHPAFANLKKEDMVKAGISIPLHPGAEKYYKEVGLIK